MTCGRHIWRNEVRSKTQNYQKVMVQYDDVNNPIRIQFTNGNVTRYVYTVTGSQADDFSFHYYTADHLGNIREVLSEDGTVEQVTNYYPFGTPYSAEDAATLSPTLQKRKYNGKEFDSMHGLSTYDYGARQYCALFARWDRMDPMCEKYYSVSPYVYCHDNPVCLTDHDGRDDYYDCYGSYLGTNNEETDYIYIAYDYKKLKNGEYVVTKDTRIPLSNASLSAESWSNIFTNILERMPDVDTSKLHNDKISVTVVGDGDYIISQYNDAGNVAEVNATTNKNHLDAHITAYIYEETNDNRYLFSTRSNIQNILFLQSENMKKKEKRN